MHLNTVERLRAEAIALRAELHDDRGAAIRGLHAAGWTYARIAGELKVTKTAVIQACRGKPRCA
jgi:hypothetical protein